MDALFTYYKAIRNILEYISSHEQNASITNMIKNTKSDIEKVKFTFFNVVINEDWIDMIESKLDYISNCIHEKRQFIEGSCEILPIEKIKGISKETVTSLAKHAEFIISENDGNIVVKKLHSTIKTTDYTIYENRFIYFLLTILKEFIDSRYKMILSYQNIYKSNFRIKKELRIDNKELKVDIKFDEIINDDKIRKELKQNEELLTRIQDIYNSVISFINSPLMVEVSKAPLIRQPITVTNTLKMDQNFKEALALYNFLVQYKGPGVEIIKEDNELNPIPNELLFAYSFLIDLYPNITYLFTNGLIKDYRKQYDKELDEYNKQKQLEAKLEVKSLKEALKNKEITIEEYALKLEKNEETLDREINSLKKQLSVIDKLTTDNLRLNENVNYLNNKLDHAYNDEKIRRDRYQEEILLLSEKNEQTINNISEDYKQKLINLEDVHNTITSEDNKKITKITDENEELKSKVYKLEQENLLLKAKLNVQDFQEGRNNTNDFLEENNFKELEQQLKLLKQMTKEQWKHTKKKLKKDIKEEYKLKK